MNNEPIKVNNKGKWWTFYLVIGLLFSLGKKQSFNQNSYDYFAILFVAILGGFSYYPLKEKIKIKKEVLKIAITISILCLASGFVMGFLTILF